MSPLWACDSQLDKLVRSTLEALTTAGAIDDDARVVEIVARKHYAESWCGARITLRTDPDHTI